MSVALSVMNDDAQKRGFELFDAAATATCLREEWFEPLIDGRLRYGPRFERAARGFDLPEGQTRDNTPTILLTGFDPFGRPGQPLPDDAWNPSAVVLRLHGRRIGRFRVESCVFPVSYAAFASGIVEHVLLGRLGRLRAVLSVSMGRIAHDAPCRAERYVVGVHQRADLHLHPRLPVERHEPGWYRIPPAPGREPGAPVYEARAPLDRLTGVTIGEDVRVEGPDGSERPSPVDGSALATCGWSGGDCGLQGSGLAPGTQLRGGPGGWFLSNEISYRIHRLLAQLDSDVSTVHIHTPYGGPRSARQDVAALESRLMADLLRLGAELSA